MRPWRSRRGQLVMPAMFLLPSLFLFVFLIYETAKLSREKIRHQFALDAAAFVEATNYSDFLNRTAYVNGAFPMRIYEQAYGGVSGDGQSQNPGDAIYAGCTDKWQTGVLDVGYTSCPGDNKITIADLVHWNNGFPRSASGKFNFKGDEPEWDIEYQDGSLNSDTPPNRSLLRLTTDRDADLFYIPNYEYAAEIFKLHVQVYSLLGQVEDAQSKVLDKLTKQSNHSFLTKSYALNAGEDASILAGKWDNTLGDFKGTPHCIQQYQFYGAHNASNPILRARRWWSGPPKDFDNASPSCTSGLFWLETVDKRFLDTFSKPNGGWDYPGLPLELAWDYPKDNYFNVSFGADPPTIHTTVSIGVPNAGSRPRVWPHPTPKFQVREFP